MSNYRSVYERRESSKAMKMIIILFLIVAALTALSKLYLEDINKNLKTEVIKLKKEKEALAAEVTELEKRQKETEKSYNSIMEKLNQTKK